MLVDRYGTMWDGDVLMLYEVSYTTPDGARHHGGAVIDKGGPKGNWITLEPAPEQTSAPRLPAISPVHP